jgi:hypothetical protein
VSVLNRQLMLVSKLQIGNRHAISYIIFSILYMVKKKFPVFHWINTLSQTSLLYQCIIITKQFDIKIINTLPNNELGAPNATNHFKLQRVIMGSKSCNHFPQIKLFWGRKNQASEDKIKIKDTLWYCHNIMIFSRNEWTTYIHKEYL